MHDPIHTAHPETDGPAASPVATDPPRSVFRHRIETRLWHWVNAIAIFVMIGSGLTILNAHPHLYWGPYGANFDHAWLDTPRWPGYLTIPASYNLAIARRWHLTFALVFAFSLVFLIVANLLNRHFQRDLRVRAKDLRAGVLLHDFREHLALRFHDPKRPEAYNIFQKLSYIAVLFLLIPSMIFTGLALSPGMDAGWPWLLDLFGGRQSARSIHFIAAAGLVLFTIVHLTLVILAGPLNEVRSMITGRWTVPPEDRA